MVYKRVGFVGLKWCSFYLFCTFRIAVVLSALLMWFYFNRLMVGQGCMCFVRLTSVSIRLRWRIASVQLHLTFSKHQLTYMILLYILHKLKKLQNCWSICCYPIVCNDVWSVFIAQLNFCSILLFSLVLYTEDFNYVQNKKLCYREEHSTSVVFTFIGRQSTDQQLINHFYVTGHESYRSLRNNAK